jgi:hypothetical protein
MKPMFKTSPPAAASETTKNELGTDEGNGSGGEAAQIPSNDDVANLAYEKFSARGYIDGYHLEDWLAAEQELIN